MKVRIRFGKGPKVGRTGRRTRRAALALAALLTPMAFLAALMGLWRVSADLGLTSSFVIPAGFFSHWQVWFAAAVLVQCCSRLLNRYGRRADESKAKAGASSDILN
jgi:hypothetical protein